MVQKAFWDILGTIELGMEFPSSASKVCLGLTGKHVHTHPILDANILPPGHLSHPH